MNSAQQIADQAIAKMDAEDAGILPAGDDDKKTDPKGGNDAKPNEKKEDPAKDAGADKPKPGEDDKPAGDKKPADDKKDDEGFTADDALETEVPDNPAAPTDNAGIQLSPAEQKHIADNIGEAIVIRGWRGEGDNAKQVEIKAYSPADIPEDFKFLNDRELAATQTGFYNLEQKANRLLGEFRQNQTTTAAQDFERRENEGIKADVADLQKDGKFPKFSVRPGAAGFDESPEAKQMAEVLAVMSERNEQYLKQYNQGRPYKHIGFAEAFDIWEKADPERQKAAKADDDQKKEDEERKKRAEHSESNRGMSMPNIVKPTIKPGTSTRDILNRIDTME